MFLSFTSKTVEFIVVESHFTEKLQSTVKFSRVVSESTSSVHFTCKLSVCISSSQSQIVILLFVRFMFEFVESHHRFTVVEFIVVVGHINVVSHDTSRFHQIVASLSISMSSTSVILLLISNSISF